MELLHAKPLSLTAFLYLANVMTVIPTLGYYTGQNHYIVLLSYKKNRLHS